jgi:ATP/maltotriose-dependent transcriptional regulator MalT
MRIGDGFCDGPYVDEAQRVLDQIADPRARTSVLLTLSYALGLQCKYAQALPLVQSMVDEINTFGLEFARPHGQWNLAFVKLGMRRFHEAESLLQSIDTAMQQRPLGHHAMNVAVLRARLLMQVARVADGFEHVRFDIDHRAAPSMHGEYIATRAVGQALLGDYEEALRSADEADEVSISSEVRVLAEGARAIVSAEQGRPEDAANLIRLAHERQAWDPVISSVRSSHTLASCLAANDRLRPSLAKLYGLSSDHGLARKAGLQSPTTGDPGEILTPREFEVLELMAQGFRNREIAEAFVISQATVKIHVRHVLAKLGVRSRTQAVARYQELR